MAKQMELEGHSDEERAALEDEGEQEAISASSDEGDEDAPAQEANDAAQDSDDDGDLEDNSSKQGAIASSDQPGEDVDSDDDDAPFAPRYVAEAPLDYELKISEIEASLADLTRKFSEGEIDVSEFVSQQRELSKQERELDRLKTKAEVSAESQAQMAQQQWQWEISRFMKDTLKNEGVDYKNNRLLNAALDQAVKDLANDPSNSDKTGEWFLEQAHKAIKDSFGLGSKATAPVAQKPTGPDTKRRPNLSAVPKTLANVPAAADSEVTQDEFSSLDKLDGMDLERALAKMPQEAQDRYLRAIG